MGLLEYSNRPRVVSKLGDNDNKNDVLQAINNLAPSRGPGSVTSEALEEAARNVFSEEAGGRLGVPRTLILVTHSKSSSSSTPVARAVRLLRAAGVRVYVVSIGNRVDARELEGIGSGKGTVYPVGVPSGVPMMATVVVKNINEDIRRSKFDNVLICLVLEDGKIGKQAGWLEGRQADRQTHGQTDYRRTYRLTD